MNSWEQQVHAKITQAHEQLEVTRQRTGIEPHHGYTPLMELAEIEEAEADDGYTHGFEQGRIDGIKVMLREAFKDGYAPYAAMRRLYALAQLLEPDLIACMSDADLASIFSETRAATNKRMQSLFKETNIRKRTQKRSLSVDRMADAQADNDNRSEGHKRNRIIKNQFDN